MDKKKNVKAVIGVIAVLVCGMIYITANYRRDSGGIIAERSADAGDPGEEASREELMTLNGIGESKASQIISYRETNGLFKKIDDIMNISGIKEGVFTKIKDHIIVS